MEEWQMTQWHIILLLGLGVCLVIGSLMLRVYSEGKYEVKAIDLAFIVIPLVVVALATGGLKGLDLFGVKVDLTELWGEIAASEIGPQVSESQPVDDVMDLQPLAQKGGVGQIPRLIEQKTEALSFRLGAGGYLGSAIEEYFEKLYGSSYLRFVVVNHPDDTLFGIYPAADLIAYLRSLGASSYQEFAGLLNNGDEFAKSELASLPGFVSGEEALSATSTKRNALQAMVRLNRESLPVVDDTERFVGTVERSKLTTNLILAVTEKLERE